MDDLLSTGEGVRCCRRRDLTYSDSNSKSSEGGSSGMDRAEDNACNALILDVMLL